MKKISFFFFSLFITIAVQAQELPIDPDTKKVTYWEVVDVAGAKQADLYKRSKNFGTVDKANIIKDDAENAVYSTKGKMGVTYPSPMKGMNHTGEVEYTLTVFSKDGKYKYVLTDLIHKSVKGDGGELSKGIPECGKYTLIPAGWATIKRSADEQAKEIIKGLKAGMRNPSKESATSNDW